MCYNRFRYYHPETGRYISEDPIKLLGGFNVFAYVGDSNAWVDVLGLELIFVNPIENAPLTGHYHTIKAGTELPNGLEIINDGEPFGEHSKGHYTIYPTEDMLFEEFQKRVSSIETEYGGKKSYK